MSRSRRSVAGKAAQRGVLHILFIIFAVIGVSLWGISEFLLSAEEESREITAESAAVATETKRILLNYALTPPPFIVDNVPDCGIHNQQGCYNYYNTAAAGTVAFAKNTPLSLPCPDLAVDGNLDGASDAGYYGCASPIAGSLEATTIRIGGQNVSLHHRFGRLPWRDERGNGLFTRGLGNRDLRDGSASRLWYGISRNVAPCVINDPEAENCPYLENTSAAINAVALLTLTTGWLTVLSQNDEGEPVVLSDRVAAVVISPGSADNGQQRPDEDLLYSGAGATVAPVLPTIAIAENYVENENADGDDTFFVYGQYGISLQVGPTAGDGGTTPTRHSEDHIEFITIDELAAAYAAQNTNLPAVIAAQLLEGYYNRHGFYPDPAVFFDEAGETRVRTPGIPATQPANINSASVLLRRAAGAEHLTNINIRLVDLPPVYLAPGWRLREQQGDFDNDPSFPFNESLAKMKTKLADFSLQEIAGSGDSASFSGYQYDYADPGHVVSADAMYGADALLFTAAEGLSRGPVFDFVARAPEILAERRVVRVILSEPLVVNSQNATLAEFEGDETAPIDAADIILPAGTELELQIGDETYVQFPAGLQLRGRRYRDAIAQTAEFPDLQIPLRVRNVTISYRNVLEPNTELLIDGNNEQHGVGPEVGWLRPVAPDGTPSRYEVQPRFIMQGPIPAYDGANPGSVDDTGYLTRAARAANPDLGRQPHYFQLDTNNFGIRDRGGLFGPSLSPDDLRPHIEIVNPTAWSFPGPHSSLTPRDLDATDNGHLGLFYLDGASRSRINPSRRQSGSGQLSGEPADIRINFGRWPFSHILLYDNNGQIPQCSPYCPYSGGFFAEEIIISLSIAPNANIPDRLHVAGIELTEPTVLPARLVDRGGAAFAVPARIIPANEEAVAGRGGFIPALRATAAVDPGYFEVDTLSQIVNLYGNAVAQLYFPLTIAGLNPRPVVAFPPPGRPAIQGAASGGADSAMESALEALPHPALIPAGNAAGLPPGTRVIFPNSPESLGAVSIAMGRDFVFPQGALALLPPGAQIFVSLAIQQVRPNGMVVQPLTPAQDYVRLPHGGIMEIDGMRPLAGGGRFDEMMEMEIRGGGVGLDQDGAQRNLRDGAIIQPLTGRMIAPIPLTIPPDAALSGETRVRAGFTRRPRLAPRTGELEEPVHPLELSGATITAQTFPAGTFMFENAQPAGEVHLGFDEDTEFTLPAGFVLNAPISGWPGGGAFGAIDPMPDGTDPYRFTPGNERQELLLSLTLPIGTRVYDKRFSANAMRAETPFSMPMAGDLGGDGGGQARFNFILRPHSDMIMRETGGAQSVIPAGSIVDLVDRRILPPVGFHRVPSVAGDLELASNGAMMIYIGEDIHAVYEYAEVAPPGFSNTADRVVIPYQALEDAARRSPPNYDAIAGGMSPSPGQPPAQQLSIPQGAIILVPPGDRLPLHANYLITLAGAQSHMRLPLNAVLVLRAGQTAEFQGGAGIDGPAYVRLGATASDGRPAAANLVMENTPAAAPRSGQSFVMLTQPARLRARPGARLDAPVGRIPPQARLDLFGNMETRANGWFFHEMLPSGASEALKNFPMVYVPSPECRREAAVSDKCDGPDFEGLTFDIPVGEEIALPQDTAVPDRFRIEAGDAGAFPASLFVEGQQPRGAQLQYLRVDENGRIDTGGDGVVGGFAASDFFDYDPPRHVVVYPTPAGLRVYLGLGAPPTDAAQRTQERENTNYVESFQPLTIHNGGYTGDGYRTPQNLAIAELPPGQEFLMGQGSRIFDGGMRPGAFGEGSDAYLQYTTGGTEYLRDLKDYVAINQGGAASAFFNYSVSLGAQMTRVDDFGRVEEHYRAADLVEATPGPPAEFLRARAYDAFVHGPRLKLRMNQTLDMEPGYLWQGVIPPGGAKLQFSRSERLHNVYWPPSPESPDEALMQSRILLRTHPSDPALNFFGAGVETVEGMDGDAGEVPARELLAMSEALFQDFSGSDYAPINRRRMQGYRTPVAAPGGGRLLEPYYQANEGPYYVELGDTFEERRSHGVNPDILPIPGARRLELLSEHALRVNYTGQYAASGRGDAEGRSYNAADPLFFANWILHGGIPNPGLASGQDDRLLTTLPANGLKVRRVRLGMDPVGAKLNMDDITLRALTAMTGEPDCPRDRRFQRGPVPLQPADITRPDPGYPGDPCPPIGRADHVGGYDAHFGLRVTRNAGAEFSMNPPMLAVVREIDSGRALTVTTYWNNYYGVRDAASMAPTLAARMIWGGGRGGLPLNPGFRVDTQPFHDAVAPAHFHHILPLRTAYRPDRFGNENIEFLYDQDWDWFAFGGNPVEGYSLAAEDPNNHIGVLSGPFPYLHPGDELQNTDNSGLNPIALGDMCGLDPLSGDILNVRFSAPPIQLAALDVTPGLAWPRPGRQHGTADLDKRIAGAFIPRADRIDLMPRLSPFDHSAPNPNQNPRTQNRYARGIENGEWRAQANSAGPGFFANKVPPEAIPANRDIRARTVDDDSGTTPPTRASIAAGEVRETDVYSETYIYMDRPFDPEYMGGKQQLVIGQNFRVEGPAAVVPPFAAANDRAAADIAAQRSRMMNQLFGIRPLGEIYSASADAADCGGMDPCPAMWTRNDWAPVLGGVVAMEAVEMNIQNINDPNVRDNIYFIQPQPELPVELEDGRVVTLLAGSVIFPYRGEVIPAESIGENARAVVDDRPAVAAVDVSPAVAPPPVRIFREKTHAARHLVNASRDIVQRARFHIRLHVHNVLWAADGQPVIARNACPAFIQGSIPRGNPEAFSPPLFGPQLHSDFWLYETVLGINDLAVAITRQHQVLADRRAQIPFDRYPPTIEVYSRYHKPTGATNFRNYAVNHEYQQHIIPTGLYFNPLNSNNAPFRPFPSAGVRLIPTIPPYYSDIRVEGRQVPGLANAQIQAFSPLDPRLNLTDIGRFARAVRSSQNASNTRGLHYFGAEIPGDECELIFHRTSPPGATFRCLEKPSTCSGLVPPGFINDEMHPAGLTVRVPVGGNPRQPERRIPASGVVDVTAVISQPRQAPEFFTYTHDNNEPIGFNAETYAQVAARGPIPPDIQPGNPLLAALQAACPNCDFQTADPADPNDNLVIRLPADDTLLRTGTRTDRIIQSYDFQASGAPLNDANPVRQLAEYQANNRVNDYYNPANAECTTRLDAQLCNFIPGNITRNTDYSPAANTPDGMRINVTHTIQFTPPAGVQVVGMEFLPRDHAGNVYYQFTNISEPIAVRRPLGPGVEMARQAFSVRMEEHIATDPTSENARALRAMLDAIAANSFILLSVELDTNPTTPVAFNALVNDSANVAGIGGMYTQSSDHYVNAERIFNVLNQGAAGPQTFTFETAEYDGRLARIPDGVDADGIWTDGDDVPDSLIDVAHPNADSLLAVIDALGANAGIESTMKMALGQAYTLRLAEDANYFDPIDGLAVDAQFGSYMGLFIGRVDGNVNPYDMALPRGTPAEVKLVLGSIFENILIPGLQLNEAAALRRSLDGQAQAYEVSAPGHYLVERISLLADAARAAEAGGAWGSYSDLVTTAIFTPAPGGGEDFAFLTFLDYEAQRLRKSFPHPAAGSDMAATLAAVQEFYENLREGNYPYDFDLSARSFVLEGSALSASPRGNVQREGFAVRLELMRNALIPHVFGAGPEVARVPIRLETYDDTVNPVTRTTATIYVYVDLATTDPVNYPHHSYGLEEFASHPLSIGVVVVNDDAHFGEVRERFTDIEVNLSRPGLPAGTRGGDYFTRMEHPLNVPSYLQSQSRRSRWTSRILGSEFHFAPIRAGECVVEPLGFLPTHAVEYDDPSSAGILFGTSEKVTARVPAVANLRWHEPDSEARGYYPSRFEVLGGNINEVRRYDGTFTRGFLARPHIAELFAAYYRGDGAWRGNPLSNGRQFVEFEQFGRFPSPARRTVDSLGLQPADGAGAGARATLLVDLYPGWDAGIGDSHHPRANEHIRLRNPLAYLWQSRQDAAHPEVMGARRMDSSEAVRLVRQNICGADANSFVEARDDIQENWCLRNLQAGQPDPVPNPYDFYNPRDPMLLMMMPPDVSDYEARYGINAPSLPELFRLLTVGGLTLQADFDRARIRVPYLPLGVNLNPAPGSDGNRRPIQALRLPHAIDTPLLSEIELIPGGLGYPSSREKYYALPSGSRGLVMNMDMSSWESIHPGLAATRGGMAYAHISTPDILGTLSIPPFEDDGTHGEAFSEFDAGGRRVLHYHRSESSPAEEPTSARQVHSSAWLRLGSEAILQRGGRRTRLAEGTVLNPIHGTYVRPPVEGRRASWRAELPWPSRAIGGTDGAPLRLVRAALILPKGTKLVLQSAPAKMRKVRAAVFFSPAPLEIADCPFGTNGRVNQLRFGETLSDGTVFSLGHPCAWLDNPENVDGDRDFIYTNRPRWNSTNTRLLSNDRVVLLGGELEF